MFEYFKTYTVKFLYHLLLITNIKALCPKFFQKLDLGMLRRKDHIQWNIVCARNKGVVVGKRCRLYGGITYSTEPYLIEIGDDTIIGGNVRFVTHDGAVYKFNDGEADIFGHFGRIIIGKNCFIGFESMFMPNIEIGDNSLVGGRSFVTKSFPPNSLIMGNPARRVGSIDLYRKAKMADQNTIRSTKFAYPHEENMPKMMKKKLIIKKIKQMPVRVVGKKYRE